MNPSNSKIYVPLEPAFSQTFTQDGQAVGFSTDAAVSLFASTSFLYTLGIMLSVVAAGVMYARAGVWRMEASERGVKKSNEEIKRTTLGLLGVLSLFVIIYTFNRDLLTGNVGLDGLRANPVKAGAVSSSSATSTPVATTSPSVPFIPANNDDPTGWNAIRDDAAMRAQLAALPNGGVRVNKNVCTTPTQTSCTTVGGWPPETPAMLAQLRSACPGNMSVTGGTEAGHRSHGPGKRPVDLSLNDSSLESCIRAFPAGPSLSYCYKTYQKFGYVFCDEISTPRHWHVQ
jgi:hypothetical protein